MAYSSIVEMTTSESLVARVAASAATEGLPGSPAVWAHEHIWQVVSHDAGWADAWDSARASASDNWNPDTGARDDVITDPMILSVVQPMVATPG